MIFQRNVAIFSLINVSFFHQKLLFWLEQFPVFCVLPKQNSQQRFLAAFGVKNIISSLSAFDHLIDDWHFGYFSYAFLHKNFGVFAKQANYEHDDLFWFQPAIVLEIKDDQVYFYYFSTDYTFLDCQQFFQEILAQEIRSIDLPKVDLRTKMTAELYEEKIKQLLTYIQRGDVFEINFCFEFFAQISLDPTVLFLRLNELAEAPFSAFFKQNDLYILSQSPERFLQKKDDELLSQPIKGTIKKSPNEAANHILQRQLLDSLKERAENTMVVDLTRNDFSKIALPASVFVQEFLAVYSFKTLNHLISTVVAKLPNNLNLSTILEANFPMPSMTGMPKQKSIELINGLEISGRGIYSGSMGYIDPYGNFDWNVLIRTAIYNTSTTYLSYSVGSAITTYTNFSDEYKECCLKAKFFIDALKSC